MKKLVAILTAVVMAALLVVPSFAATSITVLPGSDNKDVIVNVLDNNDEQLTVVYKVDVEWESLEFTFNFDGSKTEVLWNPDTHQYEKDGAAATGTWDRTTAKVTVKNHSNADVKATALFDTAKSSTKLGVTATIAEDEQTIANAEGTAVADAPKAEYTVTVTGTPTTMNQFTVDTITVSIAAAP